MRWIKRLRNLIDDAMRYRWLRQHMAYHILCNGPAFPDGWKAGLPLMNELPEGLDAMVDGHRYGDFHHANGCVKSLVPGVSVCRPGRNPKQPGTATDPRWCA